MTRLPLFRPRLAPAGANPAPSLRGTVTDPAGALIAGPVIQLRGPAREQRATTDHTGQYVFPSLTRGTYQWRITPKGFSPAQKKHFDIQHPQILDAQLAIHGEAQVIIVEDELRPVSAAPEANGSRVVLRERQLAALSDDPEELALQLQALAGPAPGPDGGEFFIDGFTGGRLPPKSAIREVRITPNPFSPDSAPPPFPQTQTFTNPATHFPP